MVVKVSKPEINVREKISELDKPSGTSGQAMLAAETPQEQFNLIGAGRRNMLINGAMQVAQRGTSATGVTSSGYIVDRFVNVISSYGTWTREQSNDAPDGFANSLKVTCTTPDTSPSSLDYTRISYNAEGQDRQVLSYGTSNAKDVTISFWVKSNVAATYVFWIYQLDSPTNRQINKLFTIDSADTWEYKTITVEGDTLGQLDNNNGSCMIMGWILAAGAGWKSGTRPSTWTAHTSADRWVGLTADLGGAANNYFQITGVQMELGKVATPFEYRSYGEELALCQRYYQIILQTNSGSNYYQWQGQVFSAYNTTRAIGSYRFPVIMRAVPSGVNKSLSANLYQNNGNRGPTTTIPYTYPSVSSIGFDFTPTSNLTSGSTIHVDIASGEYHVDAEL